MVIILNEDIGCPFKAGFEVITERQHGPHTTGFLLYLLYAATFIHSVGLAFRQLAIPLRAAARQAGDAISENGTKADDKFVQT